MTVGQVGAGAGCAAPAPAGAGSGISRVPPRSRGHAWHSTIATSREIGITRRWPFASVSSTTRSTPRRGSRASTRATQPSKGCEWATRPLEACASSADELGTRTKSADVSANTRIGRMRTSGW